MHKLLLVVSILMITFIASTAKAQGDAVPFFRDLKTIIVASETNNFASLKGELLSPATRPVKVYDCIIKLAEFQTTFNEKDGILQFEGITINYQVANAKYLLDKKIRDASGLPGYTNEVYAGDNPGNQTEKFEEMTLLKKEGATQNVLVCKRRNGAGYRIYIIGVK